MSSITWSIQQNQNAQPNYYWKAEPDSTTVLLGFAAHPLLIIPKVEYDRRISLSVKGATNRIINFYFDKPTSTSEHLNVLDAEPDFQCRVGHQQLNWEISAGIYAKYDDPDSYTNVTITYRCFTKQVIL